VNDPAEPSNQSYSRNAALSNRFGQLARSLAACFPCYTTTADITPISDRSGLVSWNG
jgi:hypothetical protein